MCHVKFSQHPFVAVNLLFDVHIKDRLAVRGYGTANNPAKISLRSTKQFLLEAMKDDLVVATSAVEPLSIGKCVALVVAQPFEWIGCLTGCMSLTLD